MKEVLFIQLPPPRFSFEKPPTNIPLAAGFLMAALEADHPEEATYEVLSPEATDVLADAGLAAIIARRKPAVVAMTLYVWNVERSLFLASNIKKYAAGARIVVGGPEVTPDNRWLLNHPAVDAGVFGEGESRISGLLAALLCNKPPEGLAGTFFRINGEIRINGGRPDPWDLRSCPYPYLDGLIEPSIDGTVFLETVRGCPFKCRYCYYHKAFQRVRFHPNKAIEGVFGYVYGKESAVKEIYLMDPTFNARKGFRGILGSMIRHRAQKDIAVHTELRADLLTQDDVRLLKDAGLRTAELGLQTTNVAALAEAGRRGHPEKVSRGANLLKKSGIEVTTGIIVGLPRDDPSSFSRTLQWLKLAGAYSVVHPFVLAVLPGTDFRARAAELGLAYDPRPPYYVRSTPTFPAEAIRSALLECEQIFDMELDYIPPPSLVDRGPAVISEPDQWVYISKWILDLHKVRLSARMISEVITKASDPFTLWFRGLRADKVEDEVLAVLQEFVLTNPHAVLNIVMEFSELPSPDFIQRAVDAAADPGLFINRSYRPIYAEGEVVSPNIVVIVRDPGSDAQRDRIWEHFAGLATVVWEWDRLVPERLKESVAPLLISTVMGEAEDNLDEILNALEQTHRDHPEEVLFRDRLFQQVWDYRTRQLDPAHLFEERILVTA